MSSPHDLPRKPLIEAILEIKWQLVDGKDPLHPLYVGALASLVAKDYPFREQLPAYLVPDDITPQVVKFRFRAAPGGWPVVQAGPGIASLNFTKDYTWPSFQNAAENLWMSLAQAFASVGGDFQVSGLQL